MGNIKRVIKIFLTFIMIVANLIPIFGPSLASNALGYNMQRHNLSFLDGIIPIILGTIIFYLWIGIWFHINNFSFYIVFIGFLSNILSALTLYFIGYNKYIKENRFP